jgi:hypothetical protein
MSSDKRDSSRLEMLGPLQGEMTTLQSIAIRELSPAGATVESEFPLPLGSLHDIRLQLSHPVVVKARVVHSRVNDIAQDVVTYVSGLEFVDVPPRILSAIATFLDRLNSQRAG